MKPHYETMIRAFDESVHVTAQTMAKFPFEDRMLYASWIAQTYFIVRHTTRFLTLAASNAPVEDRAFHYEMIHHLKGEVNHDLVALKDLRNLGFEPADFKELTETQILVGIQYHWLDRGPASSLIGYALLLEGLACKHGQEIMRRIERHGKECTAFLRLHCEVDVEHYADGLKTLEKMSEADAIGILKNLEQSTYLYRNMIEAASRGEALIKSSRAA